MHSKQENYVEKIRKSRICEYERIIERRLKSNSWEIKRNTVKRGTRDLRIKFWGSCGPTCESSFSVAALTTFSDLIIVVFQRLHLISFGFLITSCGAEYQSNMLILQPCKSREFDRKVWTTILFRDRDSSNDYISSRFVIIIKRYTLFPITKVTPKPAISNTSNTIMWTFCHPQQEVRQA